MGKHYFITGIGTDIGKTIVSAIFVTRLNADYWKPVQAGDLQYSDSIKVQELTGNKANIHPEAYQLNTAASPHLAARIDGVQIRLEELVLPETSNSIIIEGAGGMMVPLNDDGDLVVDLIRQLKAEVILVSRNYLGSINHTLLSANILKQYDIPVKGIVFNGEANAESEDFILKYTGLPLLGKIAKAERLDADFIRTQAELLNLG